MSTIQNVERRISKVEGFAVRFLYLDGTDVRGDKMGLPQYAYTRAASNELTVEAWKQTRFRLHYPGYEVDVLDSRRASVRGNTRLATVRASYDR